MNYPLSSWRPLSLKKAGHCAVCGVRIEVAQKALWNPAEHKIKCLTHSDSDRAQVFDADQFNSATPPTENETEMNLGVPGGSAKAQADRRIKQRQDRVNERFPKAGKYLLKIFPEPQSTRAWQAGAEGEIGAGKELAKLASIYGFKVLHDRLIPGKKANIDHIAITKSGIFIIDAKNYTGLIRIVDNSGLLDEPNPKHYVGNRNCTHLVHGMHYQIDVVKRALAGHSVEMPVTGVLAFYNGEWEFLSSLMPQEVVQGVLINNKGIEKILNKPGNFSDAEIDGVTKILALRLKPAS